MEVKAASTANTKFCVDLFKVISKEKKGENIFISPFSISVAVGMTQLGGRGGTAKCIGDTLGWSSEGVGSIHQQWSNYINLISATNANYSLSTANRIYIQAAYRILEDFINKTKSLYKAEPVNADFAGNPESERAKINAWVAEQTADKIKDLLPAGSLNDLTRMVLVNAVYFKGDWMKKFDKSQTKPRQFKLRPGQAKDVSMMHLEGRFAITESADLKCQALEVPYKNHDLSMIVLLPNEHFVLQDMVDSLTSEKLNKIVADVKAGTRGVKLVMPKFEVTSSNNLSDILASLGMGPAFSVADADFSGMTGGRDLYLSAVHHKAYVKVNEEGTEAAAATGAVMMMRCAPMPKPEFLVDRPFLYLIVDNRAGGMVLFIGAMMDPSEK